MGGWVGGEGVKRWGDEMWRNGSVECIGMSLGLDNFWEEQSDCPLLGGVGVGQSVECIDLSLGLNNFWEEQSDCPLLGGVGVGQSVGCIRLQATWLAANSLRTAVMRHSTLLQPSPLP